AMRTTRYGLMVLATLPCIASCEGLIDGDNKPVPALLTMSKSSVTIGDSLDFIGGDFLNYSKDSHTEIRFKGEFDATSGKHYQVDYRVRPLWRTATTSRGRSSARTRTRSPAKTATSSARSKARSARSTWSARTATKWRPSRRRFQRR